MGGGYTGSERKLVLGALEAIEVALIVVDSSLRVVLYNRAADRYFGIQERLKKEVKRKKGERNPHLKSVIPQLEREINGTVWVEQIEKTVIGSSRRILAPRFSLELANGIKNPFDIHAAPIVNEDGVVTGAVIVFYDVRPQVELEEQLLLGAKAESLSGLASALAHEIRNPLNAISLSIQLLSEDIAKGRMEKEALAENISVLQEEIGRLNRLIGDFLEYARPLRPLRRFLNINDVLTRTLKLYKSEAESKKVRIVLQPGDVPQVLVDDDQMVQVFGNLLKNSFDALSENGTLEITTRMEGDRVVVDFKDNGKGISEEEMKNIFNLFYSSKKGGTGLGLPLVLRLLDANQGYITVHSKKGRGSVFSVHLPTKIAL
ncbi:MAG: ATP-binding protein [Planctomycetota bacterium]|nr:ATP-binding protein [Planctomycetota bacterium]